MRSVFFIVVLTAAILLLSTPTGFVQAQGGLACPPGARATEEERQALLAATGNYLAALKAKDWDAAQESAETFLTGFNLTQSLMRELLHPLEIDRMTYVPGGADVEPCQASVRYTLSLRAVEPRTREPVIDVIGLPRVARWIRLGCDCPPANITPWLLVRDEADAMDVGKALAEVTSPRERTLLLLNKDEDELKGLAAALARQGYDSLEKGRAAEAEAAFGLNQIVVGQIRHHKEVWHRKQAEALEGALADAEKRADTGARGRILYSLGQVYAEIGEQDRALKLFNDSLKLLGAGGEEAPGAYSAVAAIHRNRGEYERAVEYFLKSGEHYRPLSRAGADVREGLFEVYLNLAFLYEALGREEMAKRSFADLQSTTGKGSEEEALFLLLYGLVKTVKGNVVEAVEDMERASVMFARVESEEKNTLRFMSSFLLVEPYLRRNDYPRAAGHIARARNVLRGAKEGDIPESVVLLLESMLYGAQGDERLAAARTGQLYGGVTGQLLKESGAVDVAAGGRRDDDTSFALGPNVIALEAISSILGGVLGDRPAGEPFNLAVVLNAAAFTELLRGEQPSARRWLSRALKLAEDDGDVIRVAEAHQRIAYTYQREKNYPPALEHYRKSLQVLDKARLPLTLHLTDRDPLLVGVWRNIARVHAEMGNYEQALAAYQKIFEPRGRFYRLADTAVLYEVAELQFKLGRHDQALGLVERSLVTAARGGDRDLLWKLHTLAGKAYRALKQDAAAARSFAEAIHEVEVSRSKVVGGGGIAARFFEDKLGPYHEMISMLAGQGRCAEALSHAERSKSRVLLDVLRRGGGSSRPLTAAERERERTLRAQMFAAVREYEAARGGPPHDARAGRLRVKRLEARLEYEAFRIGLMLPGAGGTATRGGASDVIDAAGLGTLLPPAGGALLEFAVTGDKTYLFVLTEGHARAGAPAPLARCEVHTIPVGSEKLKARVAEFNLRIANPNGVVGPLARELYSLLLGPARAALAGRTDVLIVPDRSLWALPFQALQADNRRYLLQDAAVAYAPSLTSLREMRKPRAGGAGRAGRTPTSGGGLRLFAVANPAGSMPPLPGAEALARRLAKLYEPRRSKVYTGAQASEERVKKEARGFDIIHVSAHGILDDDAMYSRVELSRPGSGPARPHVAPSATAPHAAAPEDGRLEAWEIMDLELDARLVVLSACETARGRASDGEGIVGLTWAMFMAGVPASVVSQWSVDEEATSELMYLFHENLLRGAGASPPRLDKAESLRQASLKLLGSERHWHPYYWAGFVLVGDSK